MNSLKNVVAMLSATALLAMSSITAFADSGFTDVSSGDNYEDDILYLQYQGIVGGYDDGSYKPDNEVNRAEMMKIIAEAMALDEEGVDSSTFEDMNSQEACFSDIPAGMWYTGYLCYGKSAGWVGGYGDGSYKPAQSVTFAEALKITYKGFGVEYTEPTDGSAWYMDAVNKARDNDWIPPTVGQDYQKNLSRGEMAGLINYVAFGADPGESVYAWPDEEVVGEIVFNSDANYTGPFPAPEGMILEGTYGSDKWQLGSGDGAYQFSVQTSWPVSIICLDDTREFTESKGGHWDDGFWAGYDEGETHAESIIEPIYDPTPSGSLAGDEYYDEGFEAGYERGYDDTGYYDIQVICLGSEMTEDEILAMYDDNGWYIYEEDPFFDTFDGVVSVAGPLGSYSMVGYDEDTYLGEDSISMTFDNEKYPIHEDNLGNSEIGPTNVDRIDMLVSDLNDEEQGMSSEELAQALYDALVYELEEVQGLCFLGDAEITTASYDGEEFTMLVYPDLCGEKWSEVIYVIKKNDAENMMLTMYFANPENIVDEEEEIDEEKLMNQDFIDQFLSGVIYQ